MKFKTSTITIVSIFAAALMVGGVAFGRQAPPAAGRGGGRGRGPAQLDACGGRSAFPQIACASRHRRDDGLATG